MCSASCVTSWMWNTLIECDSSYVHLYSIYLSISTEDVRTSAFAVASMLVRSPRMWFILTIQQQKIPWQYLLWAYERNHWPEQGVSEQNSKSKSSIHQILWPITIVQGTPLTTYTSSFWKSYVFQDTQLGSRYIPRWPRYHISLQCVCLKPRMA